MADLEQDDTTKIRESISALPWPIWARRMVYFMHKMEGENADLWILQSSVDHAKAPLDPQNYVGFRSCLRSHQERFVEP
jgi:hypothetical protein